MLNMLHRRNFITLARLLIKKLEVASMIDWNSFGERTEKNETDVDIE